MKLFEFSDITETAVSLGEVQYVRKTTWNRTKTKCPSINVGIKGSRYSLEVCYHEGYEYDRDKDYDSLIKALKGEDDWYYWSKHD